MCYSTNANPAKIYNGLKYKTRSCTHADLLISGIIYIIMNTPSQTNVVRSSQQGCIRCGCIMPDGRSLVNEVWFKKLFNIQCDTYNYHRITAGGTYSFIKCSCSDKKFFNDKFNVSLSFKFVITQPQFCCFILDVQDIGSAVLLKESRSCSHVSVCSCAASCRRRRGHAAHPNPIPFLTSRFPLWRQVHEVDEFILYACKTCCSSVWNSEAPGIDLAWLLTPK